MAVIGSGPAGFYSAYKVIQGIKDAFVDMYEHLPVPFGLVRYGVAPDHPEVKNCEEKFTEVASSPNFNFIGNIKVGEDVLLESFTHHYDAILFAYGASKDRKLGIPGEDKLNGIYSAREFVGWYNGLPEFSNLAPQLDVSDTAVVIGQGNVAMDVARTLLKDVDVFRKTDMSEQALATLSKSTIKRVRIVGRRGPMQLACTIKEVRELMRLPSVAFDPVNPNLLPQDISTFPRTAKRMTKLLKEEPSVSAANAQKSWAFDFLLSPKQFLSGSDANRSHMGSVEFARTKFIGTDLFDPRAKVENTAAYESIPTSLAFRSVGYQSEALAGMSELGIDFDEKRGIVNNDYYGRLISQDRATGHEEPVPGMYCAGWVKRGPNGVIANTMEDSFSTAEAIIADWNNKSPFLAGGDGWDGIKGQLLTTGLRTVSWEDWLRIDSAEKARGKLLGKEREKFTNPQEMLDVIHAGIYYGPTSLKTELCLKGKRMMYDLCEKQGIPYRNCKKWILAQDEKQHEQLDKTHEFTKLIGVPTHFISLTEASTREPDVVARNAVLESPTTGIIDSHTYMAYLESDFQSNGGDLACHTKVDAVEPIASGAQGYRIKTTSQSGETGSITAETLINSAGLAAVPLSNGILPPNRHMKPYYAKGSYYSYAAAHPKPKTLIYPAPTTGAAGLGTHLTMDMTGAIRFGPDVEWVDDPTDLSVNEERLGPALDEIKTYLPTIARERVHLDYAGIRPKLGKGSAVAQGKGDGFSDFYIKKEEGFEGFVNLLGIESPGLTSSLAIADMTLKASSALVKHITAEAVSREAVSTTKNLLKASTDTSDDNTSLDAEPIWLVLTTKKHIVDQHRLKPGKIPLPHSLNQSPTTTICLISCDPQRVVKDTIAHPLFPTSLSARITRVIGISKLKAKYSSFESRRQLLNEHDIFLADTRVVTMLPRVLGKIFYKSQKKPVPVTLEPYRQKDGSGKRVAPKAASEGSKTIAPPQQVAKEIEKTINCALVHLSPSNNVAIRMGLSSFMPQAIAENVEAVVSGLTDKFIPKGWRNVKSVHIKGPNTLAFPIWLASELWVEEEDVLEDEEIKNREEVRQVKAAERNGAGKKRGRLLDKVGEEQEGKDTKRDRTQDGEAKEGRQKKRRVEDSDLSKEMKERREKLREQKRLDRENMERSRA
ncbi:MAG: hypothetical protein Q9218_005730 [Villophora microphyllina]